MSKRASVAVALAFAIVLMEGLRPYTFMIDFLGDRGRFGTAGFRVTLESSGACCSLFVLPLGGSYNLNLKCSVYKGILLCKLCFDASVFNILTPLGV